MDHLVVVPHPRPIALEARSLRHTAIPEGAVGLGYYYDGHLIARSVVAAGALETIKSLLSVPVSVALAAREDEEGNIDGRICLVLPVDEDASEEGGETASEPWRASVPMPPAEVDGATAETGAGGQTGESEPQFALLPIGNVVRPAADRQHPDDVAHDAREMLDNLLNGGGHDAVQRAIEELLRSI
jgi:hypothetical protein